jgi:hypothetical protein
MASLTADTVRLAAANTTFGAIPAFGADASVRHVAPVPKTIPGGGPHIPAGTAIGVGPSVLRSAAIGVRTGMAAGSSIGIGHDNGIARRAAIHVRPEVDDRNATVDVRELEPV